MSTAGIHALSPTLSISSITSLFTKRVVEHWSSFSCYIILYRSPNNNAARIDLLEPNLNPGTGSKISLAIWRISIDMYYQLGGLRGIHQKILRPADTISACFGENFTH